MTVLARAAAESRSDGGALLQRLLRRARFDDRPRLSLLKFDERADVSIAKGDELPTSKRYAA